MKELNRILIVRTDRIGDVVLTLPMAVVLKRNFPEAKITFLVRSYTAPIVKNCTSVDEVITLEELESKGSLFKKAGYLKSFNFDTAFLVYPTFTLGMLLVISRIKNRIATGYRWYSFLFNGKSYEHRKDVKKHELEYNLSMLSLIGVNEQRFESKEWGLSISDTLKLSVTGKTGLTNNSQKIVMIHPGSGGSAVDLPESKFIELVEKLSKLKRYRIIITGSDAERNLCKRIAGKNDATVVAGGLALEEMTALIDSADLFVANSTGPIHIAAALGKKVIGFYPRIKVCSAKRWAPYTESKKIFEPKIECDNCTREQCERLNCMDTIETDDIIDSINQFLEN